MAEYSNQGQVVEVSCKAWMDPRKGYEINLYSFKISGSNKWFRTGTTEPSFQEGANIQFVNDEKNNVRLESIAIVGNAPAPTTPAQAGSGVAQPAMTPSSPATSQNRDGYWSAKEARDLEKDARYQENDIPRMGFSAAQDRAVNLVSAALAHDCLSFGTMKKGDKLDYVLQCVDIVTDRFIVQTAGSPAHTAEVVAKAEMEAAYGDAAPESAEEPQGELIND